MYLYNEDQFPEFNVGGGISIELKIVTLLHSIIYI